ncbi:MAG: lipoate-protein ligase B, partial [Rhodospirillales bacterium]|nr:lipoate-protein ligase B [Rhodospirillales bacterium]
MNNMAPEWRVASGLTDYPAALAAMAARVAAIREGHAG